MKASAQRVQVVVAPAHVCGVAIVREMARKGARVVAVAAGKDAPGLQTRFAAEKVVLPSPGTSPGSFAAWLLARQDLYGAIVIPSDDFHVREILEHYDSLQARYKLAVSPDPATGIALDKALTYEAAAAAGIPAPRTRFLTGPGELDQAAAYVGFPAMLRPSFSVAFYRQFGQKSFRLNSAAELPALFDKAAAAGHKMLLQEVIPGPDEDVADCKAYVTGRGQVLGTVASAKLSIYPPRFGTSQVQETRHIPAVEEGTRRFLEHIGFRGSLAAVEWKFDRRDSTWKLLEINARVVLSIRLMKFAGSDVLDMLWRDKLGLPQLAPQEVKYNRRWVYIKNGLLLYKKYPEERRSLRGYLRLYRPPVTFAFLDLTDMKPFLYDIAPLLGRRFGRRTPE